MIKKVLFLCTGNSCRSQMAEGLLNHYYGSQYKAYSAGTKPCVINSYAIRVMQELDIDITNQYSKHMDDLKTIDFDLVITVCDHAKESCPTYFHKAEKQHWSFSDPAEVMGTDTEKLIAFQSTRDQIKTMIFKHF